MSNTLDYQPPPKGKKTPSWKGILFIATVLLFLGVTIILPLLNRILRTSSNTTPAIQHMHQIGLAIALYNNELGGQFPDSLTTLMLRENMAPAVLVDPESDDTPATGTTPQQIAADIAKGGHQTFIYLGAGLTAQTATAGTLIAYEPLSVYQNGTYALYGDGHSEWITPQELKKELAQWPVPTSRP